MNASKTYADLYVGLVEQIAQLLGKLLGDTATVVN